LTGPSFTLRTLTHFVEFGEQLASPLKQRAPFLGELQRARARSNRRSSRLASNCMTRRDSVAFGGPAAREAFPPAVTGHQVEVCYCPTSHLFSLPNDERALSIITRRFDRNLDPLWLRWHR